ncbi:translocation protein [Lophium mytilinum]|uniref:Translocation protein n=1 Tax=Lophium mytilinum TaxID=390894 RepID=A0A6A6R0H1_9PEZI|nr:translocation protein [Lophium mytilinum]
MVDLIGLAFAIAYLGILVGSLAVFTSVYRKGKISRAASLAPWFGQHLQRDIYLTLLHQEPETGSPKVSDGHLKAALLRRAIEDIHRIVQIRNAKQALSTLLQRGSVGDDLWQRFQRAEKEIEEELRDVVSEANAFSPNWGQTIFQSASEMAQNAQIRARITEIQGQANAEKEWWERRKADISSGLMKELDEEKTAKPSLATTASSNSIKPAMAKLGSDDDAVLVDSPAGGPKGKNRKKGKH